MSAAPLHRRVLLDTGPLVALIDRADGRHADAKLAFSRIEPPLLTCEAVIAEACHLLRRLPGGREAVLALLQNGAVSLPFRLADELPAIQAAVQRYRSVPMSLADACLVRMAEVGIGGELLTFDSDFAVYRILGRRLIPRMMV